MMCLFGGVGLENIELLRLVLVDGKGGGLALTYGGDGGTVSVGGDSGAIESGGDVFESFESADEAAKADDDGIDDGDRGEEGAGVRVLAQIEEEGRHNAPGELRCKISVSWRCGPLYG